MRLEIGNNHPAALREESLHHASGAAFSVAYLSDLHFTAGSGAAAARILEQVRECRPDLILLGGDYADTRGGIRHLAGLAAGLTRLAPVCAVAGNHDYFLGIDRVRSALMAASVRWIEQEDVEVNICGMPVRISGARAAELPAAPDMFSILCLHKPAFDKRLSQYDLAFAGHLHGGQVVLWETARGLFPGRLFYRWNRRSIRVGSCHCFISAGLGDTLPIRYNCPRDIILVRVSPFSNDTKSALP